MAEKQQAQVVNTIAPAKMTLAEVRAQLEGKTGKRFWQNLDSLADSPQFAQAMQRAAETALPAGFAYEWTGVTYQQLKAGSAAMLIFAAGFSTAFAPLASDSSAGSLPNMRRSAFSFANSFRSWSVSK